MIISNNKFLS